MCDKIADEYRQMVEDKLMDIKFREYDRTEKRLDEFYFQSVNITKFKNLVKVISLLLTLSHGQAAVERGFSVNQSILETNMQKDSIVAKKLVRDHMLALSLIPESFVIAKPLITSCLSGNRRYKEHLKSLKAEKEKENLSNELKILLSEIKDTEASRERATKASDSLDEDFVKYVKQAGSEKDTTKVSTLITKANTLKRKSED